MKYSDINPDMNSEIVLTHILTQIFTLTWILQFTLTNCLDMSSCTNSTV